MSLVYLETGQVDLEAAALGVARGPFLAGRIDVDELERRVERALADPLAALADGLPSAWRDPARPALS